MNMPQSEQQLLLLNRNGGDGGSKKSSQRPQIAVDMMDPDSHANKFLNQALSNELMPNSYGEIRPRFNTLADGVEPDVQ